MTWFYEVTDDRGVAIYADGQPVMMGTDPRDIIALERTICIESQLFLGPDYPPVTDHASLMRLRSDLCAWIARHLDASTPQTETSP